MFVLLLRQPSEECIVGDTTIDGTHLGDKYERVFQQAGYRVQSVAVLEERLLDVSAEEVRAWMSSDSEVSGWIVTSRRAIAALVRAWSSLALPIPTPPAPIPLYVVGPGTADYFRTHAPSDIPSYFHVQGETTGNAQELAQFIDERHPPPKHHRLLFLCGDQRRDTIPAYFRDHPAISVEERCVYETRARSDVAHTLAHVWNKECLQVEDPVVWVVFFSPSGVDAALSTLQQLVQQQRQTIRYAAIGKTTASHLQGLGVAVTAIAHQPTPEALLQCITDTAI